MRTTQNETTTKIDNCEATVILATKDPTVSDTIIYTMELVYPRYIHSEVMTHRVFSRNAQSSRATPVKTLIKEVRENPIIPVHWYENQTGMVGGKELDKEKSEKLRQMWGWSARYAAMFAVEMQELGAHKQHVNRILEPYLPIKVVVTATDWDNFFKLRLAPDAQPEIRMLAHAIQVAQVTAVTSGLVQENDHHLPYIDPEELETFSLPPDVVSAARCARVSYYKHDGKKPTEEEDFNLGCRLLKSGHMTPFEHQAISHKGRFANFENWQSMRNWREEVAKEDGDTDE